MASLLDSIAVIPARGGSKGILKKNLQVVDGIPLVVRSILAATAARSIDRVFVSTDDSHIASISHAYGAEIIIRPKKLAEDSTSTDPVILHSLKFFKEKYDYLPQYCSLIQCTYPFLDGQHIDDVFESLTDPHDCAFACTPFHSFIWESDKNGTAFVANSNLHFQKRQRRQDQSPQYLELGSVYCMKTSAFIDTESRFCSNPLPTCLPNAYVGEIDDYKDLNQARNYARLYNQMSSIDSSNLHTIFIDFDGVLTNNTVTTFSDGTEAITTSKYDSLALSYLKHLYKVIILTSEKSPTHKHRAKKLGLDIIIANDSKANHIKKYLLDNKLTRGSQFQPGIIYIGNDLNDLDVMDMVDLFMCPYDSSQQILKSSHIVMNSKGGNGVVRELFNLLTNSPHQ